MMNLNFSLEEMIRCLVKAGYTVEHKDVEVCIGHGSYQTIRSVGVYKVYRNGEDMVPWAPDEYPEYSVKYAFERELRTKIIELF